ncbi:MAG TPA: class I SAM-dependent methyltransferase [Thermoleophilaceae bacterium]|nr:class I SAM-dependent methyltransferase [Thermoleophilaceae bacterium]
MSDLTRHYAKACDLPDFGDPRLLDTLRGILPERDPATHAERKVWEFAQLAMFLADLGLLDDRSRVLGLGAGDERILFWLANHVGQVVATDIYGEGDFAGREAGHTMLSDPAAHAPFPYREDRLQVRWMDARRLEFPDAGFDAVYSLSSLEHFGGPGQVDRAAREIARVLRPGGVALLCGDVLVRRHPLNAAPADLAARVVSLGRKRRDARPRHRSVLAESFTPRELLRHVVRASGLELMQPLDLGVSASSWENVCRLLPDGRQEPASGSFFPHVLVRIDRSVLTSVCIPLRRPR